MGTKNHELLNLKNDVALLPFLATPQALYRPAFLGLNESDRNPTSSERAGGLRATFLANAAT